MRAIAEQHDGMSDESLITLSSPGRIAAGGQIRIYTDDRPSPDCPDADAYDLLLCEQPAPSPWARVDRLQESLRQIESVIRTNPVATALLGRVLRVCESLVFDEALEIESLAYSTLLAGDEFTRWQQRVPQRKRSEFVVEPVQFERDDEDRVTIRLNDPRRLNAYSFAMRDSLAAALDSCLVDPTAPRVHLCGAGRAFCSGGAIDEFGMATDLAAAHMIRIAQSAAARVHRLGSRADVHVHGAAVGSGVEIAAAAAHVSASSDAWFQLPELGMGLIPGAGGTVTVPRRIGRHRTFFMLASMHKITAQQALEWGLVDRIADVQVRWSRSADAN